MAPQKFTYSSNPNHAARSAHAKGKRLFKTYDTSHIRPKRSKGPIIVGAILGVVVFALLLWGGSSLLKGIEQRGALPVGQEVEITVPEGMSAREIGIILQENGIIGRATDFVTRIDTLGAGADLKPGTYLFAGGMTLEEVIGALRSGPESTYKTFTIPEHYTLEQTAAKIAEVYAGMITAEEFIACANDASAFITEFPFVAGSYNNSVEGYLFPKTYPVKRDATADSVIRVMLAQYKTEVAGIDYSFAESKGFSKYQVLILASLIEREALVEEERPLVSSVIYNRLESDMILQLCSSVAYVVKADGQITPEQLKVESPYNTYLHKGLPPGPICSPGLASIQAAANPAATNYMYFVTKGSADGSHNFSATYDEHLEAIDEG